MTVTININTGWRIVQCEITRRGGTIYARVLRDMGQAKSHMAQIPAGKVIVQRRQTFYVLNDTSLANRSGDAAQVLGGHDAR